MPWLAHHGSGRCLGSPWLLQLVVQVLLEKKGSLAAAAAAALVVAQKSDFPRQSFDHWPKPALQGHFHRPQQAPPSVDMTERINKWKKNKGG